MQEEPVFLITSGWQDDDFFQCFIASHCPINDNQFSQEKDAHRQQGDVLVSMSQYQDCLVSSFVEWSISRTNAYFLAEGSELILEDSDFEDY